MWLLTFCFGGFSLHDVEFAHNMVATGELIHHEQYIADIYRDATLQLGLKCHVARHSLPVAIKCQTYQTTIAVQNGRGQTEELEEAGDYHL